MTQGDVDTKTWAIFGDFTYDITDQWSVSLGGRYTSDKRHAKVFRQTYLGGGSAGVRRPRRPVLGARRPISTASARTPTFTPRASISFKPNDDHNIYLSYSKGFKGGGFDPRGVDANAPDLDGVPAEPTTKIYEFMAFEPETVDSYELGWKGALFDKRLRMAVAAVPRQLQGRPDSRFGRLRTAGGVPTFCGITTNAGKARFQGVEVEGNARLSPKIWRQR